MIDIKLLRNDIQAVQANFARRGFQLDTATFEALESRRREVQARTQTLQSTRNSRSKAIGQAKSRGEDITELLKEVDGLGAQLRAAEDELEDVQQQIQAFMYNLPNWLDETVPEGRDEHDNTLLRQWGALPNFDFAVRDHVDLGGSQLDFEAGARLSGARFVVMRQQLARLHRALVQFMLDLHLQDGSYEEVNVPLLVNAQTLTGTGQLPKFSEDLFHIEGDWPYSLIPTAEVPVTNLVADRILGEDELPRRFVCHSVCFRSEAGSHGRDTRGLIRQHQFEKVELVHIAHPQHSDAELERMLQQAESVLQKLALPYRVVTLCSGDIGANASKTYDIEVWLPAQNAYREISSCSNLRDFQSRRMQARFREGNSGKPALLHTLNGSALAVGRTLVAILENYQQADGSVRVPEALQPYMGGMDVLQLA